jgi:hypothetical protein
MIPAENVRAIALASAELGDLFFNRPDGIGDRMVVCGRAGKLYAVVLRGKFAGQGFEIRPDQGRTGFVVRGWRIDVDTDSFVPYCDRAGAIYLGTAGPALTANINNGAFGEHVWVSPTTMVDQPESLAHTDGFTRWRIVLALPDGEETVLFESEDAEAG